MFVSCSSSPYCSILGGEIQLGWSGGTFWFAAAPLFTGMVVGPFLGVVDGGPATCRMALLLFIPSVVGKCQQGCRQMPARLSTNVYNLANKCQQPEIEVCEALGVVFPTSFGFRIMYQRSCSKLKTPFFSSKYEKSGANIWLYGKNYVPLQSQLRNRASVMRSKGFLHIAEWSSW